MGTSGPDSTLTSADLTAFANIVGMQGDVGATTLTKAGLADFSQRLYWCSFNYQTISNTSLQNYLDVFYQGLSTTTTNWGAPVPALLVAYMWGNFCQNGDWGSYYDETGSGITWQNRCAYGNFACSTPSAPANWQSAIQSALTTAPCSAYPPSTMVWFPASSDEAFENRYNIVNYEYGLFDPAKWTDVNLVAQNTSALWTAQSSDLATLTQTTPLTDQQCLYLLHLLTGLCTSPSAKDLALVNTIATLNTNSIENPNDIFIDQLTYFALMVWVDPKGAYQWTHDQLASTLAILAAATPNQDPGSVVLKKTFAQQTAVLNSSSSYPMVDPYNPSIGFPQRKTDTLAALNNAWQGLHQ